MDHSKILNSAWPYLPAFRAVAEVEHLPTAAAQLHVVPSALSRSVRLLEEALGDRLFQRAGRRLVLNSRGRALLEAMRQGALAIARGLAPVGEPAFQGEYRVASHGVLTHELVLPALLDLAAAHPGLVPLMCNQRAGEANHRLAIGQLDLAFYTDAIPLPGIVCTRLGQLGNSVYCGRGHPLFGARGVQRRALLRHAFSVPMAGERNLPMDDWPVHLERRVGFRIELLVTQLAVCRSGRFLAVLPDVVAAPSVRAGELWRFGVHLVPPTEVFVAFRQGETDAPLHRALAENVAARVRQSVSPRGPRRR